MCGEVYLTLPYLEVGILAGIATSVGLYLLHTTTPHTAMLGRIPGTQHWLDADGAF